MENYTPLIKRYQQWLDKETRPQGQQALRAMIQYLQYGIRVNELVSWAFSYFLLMDREIWKIYHDLIEQLRAAQWTQWAIEDGEEEDGEEVGLSPDEDY